MKLIVAGGRDFTDTQRMIQALQELAADSRITDSPVLVCGMARGADITAYHLWKQHGMEIIEMPADWDKHGKSAGYKRNADMGNIADACVAFWDQQSRGTKNMIDYMNKLGKPCFVYTY